MVHKKQSYLNWYIRHEVLHTKWSHFKELAMKSMFDKNVSLHGIQCMFVVDSNHNMTWIGL